MEGGHAEVGSLQEALLADPLAFLAAEHARQRALLGHLERLARHAGGPAQGAIARAVAAWLACELPLHLADEGASLYPRLAGTAGALASALAERAAELDAERKLLRLDLARLASGHRAAEDFPERALAFAAAYRRQLTAEEERLLPLARDALGDAAREAISREMAARRRLRDDLETLNKAARPGRALQRRA
jgi:hemerythrin-like domain-containing protein